MTNNYGSCKNRVQSSASDVVLLDFPEYGNKSHTNLLNPSPLQTDLANAPNHSLVLYNRYLMEVLIDKIFDLQYNL